MATADVVKSLDRFADVVMVMAYIPTLSHVKFKGVLDAARLREERAKQQGNAPEAEIAEKAAVRTPDRELRGIPPALVFLLLGLAECFASWQLFDPSDKLVRRAAGEAVRFHERAQKYTWEKFLEQMMKLADNDDILAVLRFALLFAAAMELFMNKAFHAPEGTEGRRTMNPFKALVQDGIHHLRVLSKPRMWMCFLLVVSVVAGNYSAVRKILKRSAVADMLKGLPALLRALASTAMLATGDFSDPMPHLALGQAVAAVTRAVRNFKHERVAWTALAKFVPFATTGGSSSAARLRACLALEGWSFLMLLPIVIQNRKKFMLMTLLLLPLAALVSETDQAREVESAIAPASPRLAVVFVVAGILSMILGGMRGTVVALAMVQPMIYIHGLDTARF